MTCRCCVAQRLSRMLFGLAIWLEETVCAAITRAAEAVANRGTGECK